MKPKQDVETGDEKPWVLKDLRKTCATYYDEHMPESSIGACKSFCVSQHEGYELVSSGMRSS